MLLSQPTLEAIQSDNQLWLRELELWDGDLIILQNEQALLVKELARLEQVTQKLGNDLRSHAAGVKGLREEIASSEREMVALQGRVPGRVLAETHAKTEANHAAQRGLHERLKSEHQALMTQLAMF